VGNGEKLQRFLGEIKRESCFDTELSTFCASVLRVLVGECLKMTGNCDGTNFSQISVALTIAPSRSETAPTRAELASSRAELAPTTASTAPAKTKLLQLQTNRRLLQTNPPCHPLHLTAFQNSTA
jgi:hypothetical protein